MDLFQWPITSSYLLPTPPRLCSTVIPSQTNDIAHWPYLRLLKEDFLERVVKFFSFENIGLLLITRDNKAYGLFFDGKVSSSLWMSKTLEPKEITLLSGRMVTDVSQGDYQIAILTTAGDLYFWEYKSDSSSFTEPGFVLIKSNIYKVSCGNAHTLALDMSGMVWAWGPNSYFSGTPSGGDFWKPTPILQLHPMRVIDICCGSRYSLAITESYSLYAWGILGDLQQWIPLQLTTQVTSVAPLRHGFLALNTLGNVMAFYCNANGQLKCQNVPVDQPIQAVKSLYFHNSAILVSRTSQIIALQWTRVIRTSMTSVVDAYSLYANSMSTPFLTALPRQCINPQVIQGLHHFNNPIYGDLTFNFFNDKQTTDLKKRDSNSVVKDCKNNLSPHPFKVLFANRSELELSNYLKSKLKDEWKSLNNVKITNYRYYVFFTYLRFLHTKWLELEVDWAFELYTFSLDYQEEVLQAEVNRFIRNSISDDELFGIYCKTAHQSENENKEILLYIIDQLEERISNTNCCIFYRKAHESRAGILKQSIAEFYLEHQREVVASEAYIEMDPVLCKELQMKAFGVIQK